MNAAYHAYNDIELSTDVMTASSHRLIQILINKCLQNMELAKIYIEKKDVIKKCQSISKAMYIINYLRACLNFKDKTTYELSTLLDSIYKFIEKELLDANMYNDFDHLNQAISLLTTIKSGWDGIGPMIDKKTQANTV